MMFDGDEYPGSAEMGAEYSARKRKSKNKKRFSDEQIRSMEIIFESETKLEPRKKLQVARELGLEPRQVAIWFQNKRARWKSKQMEGDYGVVLANYNALASKFEALKKENQALVLQVQKLNDALEKSHKGCGQEAEQNSGGEQLDRGEDIKNELELKLRLSERKKEGIRIVSDDGSSIRAEYFGMEKEHERLNMVEPADSSENWESFESGGGLLDESSSSYQWWDFWS